MDVVRQTPTELCGLRDLVTRTRPARPHAKTCNSRSPSNPSESTSTRPKVLILYSDAAAIVKGASHDINRGYRRRFHKPSPDGTFTRESDSEFGLADLGLDDGRVILGKLIQNLCGVTAASGPSRSTRAL